MHQLMIKLRIQKILPNLILHSVMMAWNLPSADGRIEQKYTFMTAYNEQKHRRNKEPKI